MAEKSGISTKFSKSSNFIEHLYQSRINILKYLELEGYDTTNFKDFTFNDIHTMEIRNNLICL